MTGLESREEDDPKCILFYKPMRLLGQIRPHRRDETWSDSLCQTFFDMTMGVQIPVIDEKPLVASGCRKFQLDAMGDHLCTCTSHSGAKKAHDWVVDQLADLFRTTHHTKTQHVTKNRGRRCGDTQLEAYLTKTAGPVPLVLDLHITHDRFWSISDPSLNGHLHYPNDIDKSLHETVTDKIRKYRADYKHNPPSSVSFMSDIAVSTSGRLRSEFILLFLQALRETDLFFAASGIHLVQSTSRLFHFHRAAFSSTLKVKVGCTLRLLVGGYIRLLLSVAVARNGNRQLLFLHDRMQSLLARQPDAHTIIKPHGGSSEDPLKETYPLQLSE